MVHCSRYSQHRTCRVAVDETALTHTHTHTYTPLSSTLVHRPHKIAVFCWQGELQPWFNIDTLYLVSLRHWQDGVLDTIKAPSHQASASTDGYVPHHFRRHATSMLSVHKPITFTHGWHWWHYAGPMLHWCWRLVWMGLKCLFKWLYSDDQCNILTWYLFFVHRGGPCRRLRPWWSGHHQWLHDS